MCVCVESALQLVYASKETGGNVRTTAIHHKVDESSVLVEQAAVELTATLEKAGGIAGLIHGKLPFSQENVIKGETLYFCAKLFFEGKMKI